MYVYQCAYIFKIIIYNKIIRIKYVGCGIKVRVCVVIKNNI
jgi:hypothetical protein